MSGSVNKVILVGNLGADPEIRHTNDGRKIANLRIATSEKWRDKNSGEQKERVEWHRVTVFSEGIAKICEQYLKKGSTVYLEGQLQTRKWQDQDGNDRYSTEIVIQGYSGTLTMLGGNQSKQDSQQSNQREDGRPGDRRFDPQVPDFGDQPDDVPF